LVISLETAHKAVVVVAALVITVERKDIESKTARILERYHVATAMKMATSPRSAQSLGTILV